MHTSLNPTPTTNPSITKPAEPVKAGAVAGKTKILSARATIIDCLRVNRDYRQAIRSRIQEERMKAQTKIDNFVEKNADRLKSKKLIKKLNRPNTNFEIYGE